MCDWIIYESFMCKYKFSLQQAHAPIPTYTFPCKLLYMSLSGWVTINHSPNKNEMNASEIFSTLGNYKKFWKGVVISTLEEIVV